MEEKSAFEAIKQASKDQVKLSLDHVLACLTFKDTFLRKLTMIFENDLSGHAKAIEQARQRSEVVKRLTEGLGGNEFLLYDKRQVDLSRETMVSELSRVNSLMAMNCSTIDHLVIRILHNLNSDKFDEVKPELGKLNGTILSILREKNQAARDNTVQTLYEYLKGNFAKNRNLRLTYKEQVFKNSQEILDLAKLVAGAFEQEQDSNIFKEKLIKTEAVVHETLLNCIDILNDLLTRANDLKLRIAGIGIEERNKLEVITTDLVALVRSVGEFDSAVYGMIIMDLNFFAAMVAKSLTFVNRELLDCSVIASKQSVEASNAFFYLELTRTGGETLPDAIADFLKELQTSLHGRVQQNINRYLVADDDTDNANDMLEDLLEKIVKKNYSETMACIEAALAKVNIFLEEISSGRHLNPIKFSVFGKTFTEIMSKIGHRLASIEDYR